MQIEKHNFDQECGVFKYDTLGYFYSCKDIDPLLEELETLRASNRIRQANIERLEAENERLKTELLCLTHDRDALLAEREGMMKQEPVAFISPSGDLRKSSQAKYAHEWGAQFTPLYARPLPAQQIPEGWKVQKHIIEGTEIEEIILTSPEDFHVAFRCYEDYDFGHPKNVIFRYFSQLSASQPKGDV